MAKSECFTSSRRASPTHGMALNDNSRLYTAIEVRLGSLLLSRFGSAIRVERGSELIEQGWEVTERYLAELQREAAERNARLVLQYIPNQLDAVQGDTSAFERLDEVAKRLGIPLAPSPLPLFENESGEFYRNDFYFPIDAHWTPESHARVGRRLAAFVWRDVLGG